MYTQGLGQPRMSSEERVLDMMAQLDEHSDKIPEGMYLQFCDHLKFFYQNDEKKRRGWRRKGGRPSGGGERCDCGGGRDGKATGDARAREAGWSSAERLSGRDEKAMANARDAVCAASGVLGGVGAVDSWGTIGGRAPRGFNEVWGRYAPVTAAGWSKIGLKV